MKRIADVAIGILVGGAIGLFAQSLEVTNIPSYVTAHKYTKLILNPKDRLVVVVNPKQISGGKILIDYAVPAGQAFSGDLRVNGTFQ